MENKVTVDIIILSYAKNDFFKEITENAVNTINSANDSYEKKIIVVESNSGLKGYQYPFTNTIYPNTKFGYNKFINIGLKHSNADFVCIANNDLTFDKEWLNNIIEAFNRNPELASASPICPENHKKYQIFPNSGIYEGYRTAIELSGWCLVFRREILKFNLFDNNLSFWYCDNDYANTLKKNNLKHALVTKSIVHHLESITLKGESPKKQSQLTFREKIYFDYKWEHKNWKKYKYRQLRFDYPFFRRMIDNTINLFKTAVKLWKK
ncbi:glycosyltransferase family 2 protein [Nubsella zeaxanthinifaciens]|jgi:GT2 family glycosyltransferase|uniref:glycosyltransferase family 2 protein n=1 Tax=Nubsella zeaxanthinifaciens TaxID=392412 RepID=UPI000DE3FA63|nr:glycosyltransferase [Nubsella zeaxanthinifaciens]